MRKAVVSTLLVPVFVFILFCATVPAAKVTVHVDADPESTRMQLSRKALEAAFREAVFAQALQILPAPLPEPRAEALREFLSSRSADYVLSYSETGSDETEAGFDAVFEIAINRTALKRDLQRIGVFYTTREPLDYSLTVRGPAMEQWGDISRLQMLSGLTVENRAMPSLTLEVGDEGVWNGELAAEAESWQARSDNLEELWFTLWSNYFAQTHMDRASSGLLTLRVTGWYASDGVRAFDSILAEWNAALESAKLVKLEFGAAEVAGVWLVETLDRAAFEERLASYLPDRGLSWEFGAD